MKKSQRTKRAFISSLLSVLVCVSMLVGSTYAWFTDTVTVGVNTIQSGTLDVDLVSAADDTTSLEGETLEFVTADNRAQNQILWEPGCTYELEGVKVKNNGNLALKYKIVINGIDGDAPLLEAIDWTVSIDGTDTDISTFVGHLDEQNDLSGAIVLKGHMREEAGNEYQGLTIEGVGITVVATQYTYENDSYDDQYDAGANLDLIPLAATSPRAAVESGNASFSAPVAPADNQATTVAITGVDANDGDAVVLNVDINDLDAAQATFAVEENHTAVAGIDLSLTDTNGQKVTFDSGVATVTTYILTGLDPTKVDVKYNGEGAAPILVSYNPTTGELVFTTTHFSSYYVDYNGAFAYVPQLNAAFTGSDCGGDALDAITLYAENSVEGLYDALDVEAMTEFYCEEAFESDVHTIIKTALIGGCQGFRPYYVEEWVEDFAIDGADVLELAQQYFEAYKACVVATEFYPRGEGTISAWAPWPMGVSFGSF